MFPELNEIFKNFKNIQIIEHISDPQVAVDYFMYCAYKRDEDLDPDIVLEQAPQLFSDQLTLEQKKELIANLAIIDKIEAHNFLKQYIENPDPQLTDWASVALQENTARLQSALLNEPQLIITSTLGGKNNKLRYFAIVYTKNFTPLQDWQTQLIEKELNFAFDKTGVELEQIQFGQFFANLVLLVPLDVELYQILTNTITKINELGDFLEQNPIINTDKIFSIDETKNYLENQLILDQIEDQFKPDWDNINDLLDNENPDNPPENDDK